MLLNLGNLLIAGVTERQPDIFQPIGLTLGKAAGISASELVKHRQYFADSIRVSVHNLKFQRQVHGSKIKKIDRDTPYSESDGMITNKRGIVLCVLVADCCGILLYDKVHQAIGAFHSGWRGTHQNIISKGVSAMQHAYDTDPTQLHAYLSPCASGDKYIVRKDVADLFPTAARPISDDEYLFDNRKRITEQIMECGVLRKNILVSTECSMSDTRFHSYRRDGSENSGRTAVFIGLK